MFSENNRLDELIFNGRNLGVPCVLRFHPYEPHLAVADKDHIRYMSCDSIQPELFCAQFTSNCFCKHLLCSESKAGKLLCEIRMKTSTS